MTRRPYIYLYLLQFLEHKPKRVRVYAKKGVGSRWLTGAAARRLTGAPAPPGWSASPALTVAPRPPGVSVIPRCASHPTTARKESAMPNEGRICGASGTRDFSELGIGWLCSYGVRPDGDEVTEQSGQGGRLGSLAPPPADAA